MFPAISFSEQRIDKNVLGVPSGFHTTDEARGEFSLSIHHE
ncbi:hypothetical protein B4113_2095 [Geobacillus sp. B4113_201601]|nr:hypothetical protein B4113_2095 [Geobacillus sp. B4113_201601]